MAKSLQEQLLASGVAKPKQAKKARRDKTKREREARRQGRQSEEAARLARDVAAAEQAKRERDLQLAEQQKQERARRESQGAAAQLIAQHGIKPVPSDDVTPYSYSIAGKIRKLAVSAPQRQQLADGKLGIVRHAGSAKLLDRDVAQRLQALIPDQIWLVEPQDDAPDPDDPYAGYEVPDDLMW